MDNRHKTASITIQHGTQKWSKGASENGIYRPRQPENSAYYQCVEDHFEDFEQVYEERFERAYGFYRPYLRSVIYRYLDCGILRNGFARVRCGECGHEYLLAFSCERRHFCPSCHQKRVVEFGEWVCGEVFKKVPFVDSFRTLIATPSDEIQTTFEAIHTLAFSQTYSI
jgi:hypothetical protein